MLNNTVFSATHLPTLGLGVSLSLSAEPSPLHMLASAFAPQFIEYAGLADVERVKHQLDPILTSNTPVLYHPSYVNFCGTFSNSKQWLDLTQQHIEYVKSPWLAQDCAYCFWQDQHGYSTQLGYFIPPIFNEASLQAAIKRVKEIQDVISVPVVIEPPPVVFVAGNMPLLTFFGRLALAADCAILLDMGHLVSWEKASGQSIFTNVTDFPFDRVIEVHIAGGKMHTSKQGEFYVDAHECDILPDSWQMLEKLLPLLPCLKAICYECEGITDKKNIIEVLKKIHTTVLSLSRNKALLKKIEQML